MPNHSVPIIEDDPTVREIGYRFETG